MAKAQRTNQIILYKLRLSQSTYNPINKTKNEETTLIETRAKDTFRYFNAVITQSGAQKFVIPIIQADLIV
jgi:hypothetical protein